jgi:hypothetical protein
MKGILTPEEKKYLRKITNYLRSLGMYDGNIEFEVDFGVSFDPNDIDWEEITHFSNNYRAEVPSGLIPILQKIIGYVEEHNLINEIDEDDINYQRLEIDIDNKGKSISFNHWWSFYERGDGSSVEYDSDEGRGIFEEWEKDGVFDDLKVPEDGILTAVYTGSGDSGYLEDFFNENNESVPDAIEGWCYTQLSNEFGGWEDNEGADGEFIFDFNNKTITLYHTENVESTESNTLFEENFGE